jgi:hypothetical protein
MAEYLTLFLGRVRIVRKGNAGFKLSNLSLELTELLIYGRGHEPTLPRLAMLVQIT